MPTQNSVVALALFLAACGAAPAAGAGGGDCPLILPQASPTPIVVPAITTGLGPCVAAKPTAPFAATATAGPGLGAASTSPTRLTLTADNDALLGVWPVDSGLVAYRNAGTAGAITLSRASGAPAVAFTGDSLAVAERADGELAVGVSQAGRLLIYTGATMPEAQAAQPLELGAGAADDLALGYGPDGWLYAAAGGLVRRYDPFTKAWKDAGGYMGAALHLTRTEAGAQLLLTSAGIFRKPITADSFALITSVNSSPGSRLAVWRERAAYAYAADAGRHWLVVESADGGATWGAPQLVAELPCDCARDVWAAFSGDGALEVVGLLIDDPALQPAEEGGDAGDLGKLPAAPDQLFPYLAVSRQAGAEWYPPAQATVHESLIPVGNVRPIKAARCVSEQGLTVCAWEARQWNGTHDVEAVTR